MSEEKEEINITLRLWCNLDLYFEDDFQVSRLSDGCKNEFDLTKQIEVTISVLPPSSDVPKSWLLPTATARLSNLTCFSNVNELNSLQARTNTVTHEVMQT